jgi:hypothetical protein
MSTRQPPVPAKFDDQLEALIERIKAEGWDKKFSIDVKALSVALVAQRAQKGKDVALKQAYDVHHKTFLGDQAGRYRQYMDALSVIRAAHRSTPEILASLGSFKRAGSSRRKKPTGE